MNSMVLRCLLVVPLLLAVALPALRANPPEPISLWPKGAPGDTGNIGEEHDTTKPTEATVAGKRVIRLGDVSNPTITVYRPPKERDTGAAVVVCPGGGYNILALDLEGTEVCDWLNSIGVTGVLLKYRVPVREGRERYAAPLQDAQRALGLVRHQAKEWSIDPGRIGILGFSAGGHLAAAAATNYEKRTYDATDEADTESCRPDFVVLIYPAYLALKSEHDKLSPELKVNGRTPPTFLAQTQDDAVGVWGSMTYALALQSARVPAELHIYPTGGHGYGLRATSKAVTTWPQRAEEWLRGRGILEKK
jgi:acetyl esterase/lipase